MYGLVRLTWQNAGSQSWVFTAYDFECQNVLTICNFSIQEGNVPLHWAAFSGSAEVCKLLLSNHVNINTVNEHLETSL